MPLSRPAALRHRRAEADPDHCTRFAEISLSAGDVLVRSTDERKSPVYFTELSDGL